MPRTTKASVTVKSGVNPFERCPLPLRLSFGVCAKFTWSAGGALTTAGGLAGAVLAGWGRKQPKLAPQ